MDELRELFLLVADICDGGVVYNMDSGADRYDGLKYGEALQTAYSKAINAEPASSWYDEALAENNANDDDG